MNVVAVCSRRFEPCRDQVYAMPLDDLAGGVIAVVGRFFASLFSDVILEVLIRGVGYAVCRVFSRRVDPEGFTVVVVGLSIWLIVGVVVFAVWPE